MICPGRCNEGRRRAVEAGRPVHGDPVEGQPVWCRPCQSRILSAIESLPGLAAGIFQLGHRTGEVARVGGYDTGRTATKVHAPTISPAWEAIDEIVSWAVDQERWLRSDLYGGAPRPRWHGGSTEQAADALNGAVTFLLNHSTPLLCSEWAHELGVVTTLARRAERASGLDSYVERLTQLCLACKKPRLIRRDGSDVVRCRSCGNVEIFSPDSG